MRDDASNSNGIRRLNDAKRGIANQCTSDPFASVCSIYGQASEHHDRDRVRHVATKSAGRLGDSDRAGSRGVIADDTAFLTNNERAQSSRDLVFQCAAFKPGIKCLNPAAKALDIVMTRERFGSREPHASSHGARACIVLRSRGFGLGGMSRRWRNSA